MTAVERDVAAVGVVGLTAEMAAQQMQAQPSGATATRNVVVVAAAAVVVVVVVAVLDLVVAAAVVVAATMQACHRVPILVAERMARRRTTSDDADQSEIASRLRETRLLARERSGLAMRRCIARAAKERRRRRLLPSDAGATAVYNTAKAAADEPANGSGHDSCGCGGDRDDDATASNDVRESAERCARTCSCERARPAASPAQPSRA